MAFIAITSSQTNPPAGVWRHLPRPRKRRPLLRDMAQLLIAAVSGALATGMIATLVLMSGAARAHVPNGTEVDQTIILEPGDLAQPPICTCTLQPLERD